MSDKTRHEQLTAAGWIYDAASDRYSAPGSATDGTQKLFNQEAAWRQFQADQIDSASEPSTPPAGTRRVDPRIKEPE